MSRILSRTRQMPAATPIRSNSPEAPMEDGGGPAGGLLPSDDAGWDGGVSGGRGFNVD